MVRLAGTYRSLKNAASVCSSGLIRVRTMSSAWARSCACRAAGIVAGSVSNGLSSGLCSGGRAAWAARTAAILVAIRRGCTKPVSMPRCMLARSVSS